MSKRVDVESQILQEFSLPSRAERAINHHVHELGKEHLQIGVSKEQYIKQHAAEYNTAHGRAADHKLTISDKSQISQLHSWGEYHKFCSNFKGLFTYARAAFDIKDYKAITPEVAKSFCSALAERGYSLNTVNGYISTIEKVGAFTGQGSEFQKAMKEFRSSDAFKTLENKAVETRAYEKPQEIINALKHINASNQTIEKASLVATLELKYGLRSDDACHFKIIDNDRIFYNSKNGMKTEKILAPEDMAKARALAPSGKFSFSPNTMKSCWGKACAVAGVKNNGQHGLRHNFAQNLYNACRSRGLSDDASKKIVSKELNHERPQITQTYLR